MKNKLANGFTLIEVLVALAIVAIALVAVIKIAGQTIWQTTRLQQKIAAHWVAMNVLAEAEIGLIDMNKASNFTGEETMLGGDWQWQLAIDRAAVSDNYVRVTVTVMAADSQKATETLSGFVRLKHA